MQFYLFFHWNPYSTPYSNSFIQIPTFIVWDQNECNSTRIIVYMQLQVKVSKISLKWSFIVHCHIHTLTIFIWIKNLDLLSLCMFQQRDDKAGALITSFVRANFNQLRICYWVPLQRLGTTLGINSVIGIPTLVLAAGQRFLQSKLCCLRTTTDNHHPLTHCT